VIKRDMHTVEVIAYSDTLDSYGQKQTAPNRKRKINMAIYDYSCDNTNDIRMVDVIKFALTDDDVSVGEHIIDNHVEYYITKIMGNGRHKQVYMRLV